MAEYGTEEWRRRRIADGLRRGEYVLKNGIPVCATCGGNCGQCGSTGDLGNIGFNFQSLVDNLGTGDGRPAMRHENPNAVARLFLWFTRPFQWRP